MEKTRGAVATSPVAQPPTPLQGLSPVRSDEPTKLGRCRRERLDVDESVYEMCYTSTSKMDQNESKDYGSFCWVVKGKEKQKAFGGVVLHKADWPSSVGREIVFTPPSCLRKFLHLGLQLM